MSRIVNVLFVCTGNICRSPAAEGVFRALVDQRGLADRIGVDSAGTGSWHVGEPPDERMQETALRRGVDLSAQRARQVHRDDFGAFDVIAAMDRGHLRELAQICPPDQGHRLTLFLEKVPDAGTHDVPDPYYGAADGFEAVMDLVERGAAALLAEIEANHL